MDEVLIARKWVKEPRININIKYNITKIEGRQLTVQNISDDKNVIVLSEEFVDETFIYSHCATCHSSQGSSIKETLTTHEWDLPFVSREWLYTALTRCVDFRNEAYQRGLQK